MERPIMLKFTENDYYNLSEKLLREGNFKADLELKDNGDNWRLRVIELDGTLYQHIMINGNLHELYILN